MLASNSSLLSRKIYGYLYLTRPFNGITVLLAFAVAFFLGTDIFNSDFYIFLWSLFLVHSASTVQNDYYDLKIDKSNARDGLLVEGEAKLSDVKVFYYLLNLAAVILPLFTNHKFLGVSIIISLVLLGTLYNAKPFYLSRKPISSILLLAIYYATIPMILGFQIIGSELSTAISLSVIMVWTFQKFSISILKDYKDIKGDKKYGKKTFLIRYGSNKVKNFSIFLGSASYILAVGLLVSSDKLNSIEMLILASIAIGCFINRHSLMKFKDSEELNKIFQKSFMFDNYFNLAVIICLIRF